jgi:hypothetical protein
MDKYFQEYTPLLTKEREIEIRESYDNIINKLGYIKNENKELPIKYAYDAIFSHVINFYFIYLFYIFYVNFNIILYILY